LLMIGRDFDDGRREDVNVLDERRQKKKRE
jgi:hypothetical protein